METLYSVDKKGKIRVFQGELSLSGPATPNTARYRTMSGLLEGKLTEKVNIVVNGKQGRSVNQQAQFELASLYKEKKDEGYKSLPDLEQRAENIGVRTPSLMLTDTARILDLFKSLALTYNTNQNWEPLPMLAEKYKDAVKKIKYPCAGQPKLNGVRCLTIMKAEMLFLSRGGQYYKVPHLVAALKPFFDLIPNLQLDGELYQHGVPLQALAGVAKLEDESQFDRKKMLQYHIYDLAMPNLTQDARLSLIGQLQAISTSEYVYFVPTQQIHSSAQAKVLHDNFVGLGYEGLMLRNLDTTYQFGFRDSALVKMKEFIDEEFEILGCALDEVGAIDSFVFTLQNNINDLTFKARPTGSREDKAIWLQNIPQYIGKKATIRYQERTVDGLPHQAHVRHKDSTILIEAVRDYE